MTHRGSNRIQQSHPSEARISLVERCIRRYDTLLSADRAEIALGIARAGNHTPVFDPQDLLRTAVTMHLDQARDSEPGGEVRHALNCAHAAALGEFAQHVGLKLSTWYPNTPDQPRITPQELFRKSLEFLGHFESNDVYDVEHISSLEERAYLYCAYVRCCRLLSIDDLGWSEPLFALDDNRFFVGSGGEHEKLNIEYERIATLIERGDYASLTQRIDSGYAAELDRIFHESWWRGRLCVAFSLGLYLVGKIDTAHLFTNLRTKCRDRLDSQKSCSTQWLVHDFNLNLCLTEVGVQHGMNDDQIFQYANAAYRIAEELCTKWRIVTRAQSPLSLAIRQCLGDLADVCAQRSGRFDELGFRIALLVKRAGVSHLMQNASIALPKHIHSCLQDFAKIDRSLWESTLLDDTEVELLRRRRDRARERIFGRLHYLAIDYIDPTIVSVDEVRERLGGRAALDYTWLECTMLRSRVTWYRSTIHCDGSILFEKQPHDSSNHSGGYLEDRNLRSRESLRTLSDMLLGRESDNIMSRYFASRQSEGPDAVPDLIVCADGALSNVPWGSLPVSPASAESDDLLMVEAACLSMVPTLASLTGEQQSPVAGKSAMHVVPDSIVREKGERLPALDVRAEVQAWGLSPTAIPREGGSLSAICFPDIAADPTIISERLIDLLRNPSSRLGFLHIAAHGDKAGQEHAVYLPEPLTAASSFALNWPTCVLLATCHLGTISRSQSEPLAFCISTLVGGASCAVTGAGPVTNEDASAIASTIVKSLRRSKADTLPRMLRAAQIDHMKRSGSHIVSWSNMVAYIR